MADSYGLLCLEKDKLLLKIKELVALRDVADVRSNVMNRFKSGIKGLRPVLRGLISINQIKARLTKFKRASNFEVKRQ